MNDEIAKVTGEEARRITDQICLLIDSTAQNMARLAEKVQEAYRLRVDKALGYGSWQEYASAEFAPHTNSMSASIRRELVGYLSQAGLSTRAQAPVLGVDYSTVSRDKKQVLRNATPEIPSRYNDPQGDSDESVTPAPTVTVSVGLDGKSYHRPAPFEPAEMVDADTGEILERKPRRTPLPKLFDAQIVNLTRTVGRLSELADDERFGKNRIDIRNAHQSDIERALAQLSKIREALTD